MTILYVAARLPTLSETFVYREYLGLRSRGRKVSAVSVYRPLSQLNDRVLSALSDEASVVYSTKTLLALPIALFLHPIAALQAVYEAFTADHRSMSDRTKHIVQAMAGIVMGWRLRHTGISAVHAHMANTPAMIALYIARTLQVPFSFTGHAADLFVQRTALAFKLRNARFIACISHWHSAFYRDVSGVPLERRRIVRCSVAIPEEIAPERLEIITVARSVQKKGIDLLIEAFSYSRPDDWTLRIIGDGPERASLEQQVAGLGLQGRILFEGARAHAECLTAIAGAGMFVLPCRTAPNDDRDGIPVVLMEAMAAGRAVIAGDLPTIAELIANEETGLLTPANDVMALSANISRLATEPMERHRMGTAARRFVSGEFSDAINLHRLEAAFDGQIAPN